MEIINNNQMEKVIILKGASNRGKSSTLLILIEKLLAQYKSQAIYPHGYTFSTNECFVILSVPNFGNVGIIPFGDNGSEQKVKDCLQECLSHNCIAVIGASHMQYNRNPDTVYKILWDFGDNQNAKVVETTTLIFDPNFGQPLQSSHVNSICADYLISILFNL